MNPVRKFNKWLALRLGDLLSSMGFFYFCVLLDLIELKPVIDAHSVIVWCTYISQTVIQLIALPILGVLQKLSNDHHESAHEKLDKIMDHHGL
jgi:hypothetical protein